jgi:hypothetical protein
MNKTSFECTVNKVPHPLMLTSVFLRLVLGGLGMAARSPTDGLDAAMAPCEANIINATKAISFLNDII